RDDRLAGRLGREVALVGDGLELGSQTEGTHDLGRRRQEGHDLHRGSLARRSEDSRRAIRSPKALPAVAPSSSRWSNVSESVHAGRAVTTPSTTRARGSITPRARIAPCPGVRMGVPNSDP